MGIMLALGLLGAFVGMMSSSQQAESVAAANQTNKDIASANNETSIAINEANIAAQKEENALNREFNSSEAEKAFQRQVQFQQMMNNYNSPVQLVKRIAEAGINPNVAFGNGSFASGQSAVGSEGSASYGSGLSPSMPILTSPQIQPVPSIASGLVDSLSKIAGIDKTLSESGLNRENTTQLQSTRNLVLRNLEADATGKELSNYFQQQYGDLEHETKIEFEMTAAMKNIGAFNKALSDMDVNQAEIELKQAMRSLTEAEEKLTGEKATNMHLANENFNKFAVAKIHALNAQANRDNSQANLNSVQANRINELLQDEKWVLKADKRLKENLGTLYYKQGMNEGEKLELIKQEVRKTMLENVGIYWQNHYNIRNEAELDAMIKARLDNVTMHTVSTLFNTGSGLVKALFGK